MEEWVLLGESGSDADSVQFDDDGSASDKGSEMSFTAVQVGRNRRAHDAAAGEELQGSPIGGENEDDEEESNGDYGYFDLDLPALAGSKAVFGASGDSFDPNLAASILSMGSVEFYTGIHGAETEDTDSDDADEEEPPEPCTHDRHLDDIDMESVGAADDGECTEQAEDVTSYNDIDTGSSDPAESDYDTEHSEFGHACCDEVDTDADEDQPESSSRGGRLDDIDMESLCGEAGDDFDFVIDSDEMWAGVREAVEIMDERGSSLLVGIPGNFYREDGAESDDGEDTESSDEEESDDYSDDGTVSTDAEDSDYSDDCTESSDEEESDDDDTESSDEEESDDDDDTESSDEEESAYSEDGTDGSQDMRNSDFNLALERRLLASRASSAALPPPTAPHLYFPYAPLFVPDRTGASTAAPQPPCAPHLYFRNRAG